MSLVARLNSHYRKEIEKGNFPVCYLCGHPITKTSEVSQDHLIAKARGGQTTAANLVITHKLCNNLKGSMTVAQWFNRQRE